MNKKDYSDIIDHPHYQSKTRPHMSQHDRAAQFAPFAALSGYGESVKKTQQQVEDKMAAEIERIPFTEDT